ncbi:hypothetical protein HRbin32_00829 [bacterium HR32]|nr:hypothetical protein HRbin32_00829 [bacterium HR32]
MGERGARRPPCGLPLTWEGGESPPGYNGWSATGRRDAEGPGKAVGARGRPRVAPLPAGGGARERAGVGVRAPVGRGPAGQDGGVPPPAPGRRDPGRPPARSVRRGPGGQQAHPGAAPLRRAAHRRRGPPRGKDRGDEDRRRQDAGRHPASVPERPPGPRVPPGHPQRLPVARGRGVDGAHLPSPRRVCGGHLPRVRGVVRPHLPGPQAPRGRPLEPLPARAAAGGLPGGHHLRHQQRVRVRLPAGQHGSASRGRGAARAVLRHRGRGGLHPDRRSPHPPHHLRPSGGVHPQVLRVRQAGPPPAAGRGLHRGREGQERLPHRRGRPQGGAHAGPGQPGRPRERGRHAPRPAGPPGPHLLPPGRGLRGEGRPGDPGGRVHRPPHVRAALLGRPAPGHRGEGRGADRTGDADPGLHHLPELLSHVREAGGHDGHRQDGGGGAPQDLRARGGGGPHPQAHDPGGPPRRGVQDGAGQVAGGGGGDQGLPPAGPTGAGGDPVHREERDAVRPSPAGGHPAPSTQRQAPRAGGTDHRPGRPPGGGDHRHQHGGPRGGHPPRGQPAGPRGGRTGPPAGRPVRDRDGAARGPSDRQPAAGPGGPPGGPGVLAVLPVAGGRTAAAVRGRAHRVPHGPPAD